MSSRNGPVYAGSVFIRHLQREFLQVPLVNGQVQFRRAGARMAQHIGDGADGGVVPHEVGGQGVAEGVRPVMTPVDVDPGLVHAPRYRLAKGGCAHISRVWGVCGHEDIVIVPAFMPAVLQIVDERQLDRVHKGQGQRAPRLPLDNVYGVVAPVYVLEPQVDDVAGPKPEHGRKADDEHVPAACRASDVYGGEHPVYLVLCVVRQDPVVRGLAYERENLASAEADRMLPVQPVKGLPQRGREAPSGFEGDPPKRGHVFMDMRRPPLGGLGYPFPRQMGKIQREHPYLDLLGAQAQSLAVHKVVVPEIQAGIDLGNLRRRTTLVRLAVVAGRVELEENQKGTPQNCLLRARDAPVVDVILLLEKSCGVRNANFLQPPMCAVLLEMPQNPLVR